MENKELEALKYVNGKIADLEDDLQHYTMVDKDKCKEFYIREDLKQFNNIWENLQELKAIKESNSSEVLKCVDVLKEDGCITTLYQGKALETIRQYILKAQEQEKENEILREIIKSFFDKGSPLHQYIDNKFGLTIEVDNECSIMQLGKFKDVDLDKKLKEVLEK